MYIYQVKKYGLHIKNLSNDAPGNTNTEQYKYIYIYIFFDKKCEVKN